MSFVAYCNSRLVKTDIAFDVFCLVATAAVYRKKWDLSPQDWLDVAQYTIALAGHAAWALLHRTSYIKYRTLSSAALRLGMFAVPGFWRVQNIVAEQAPPFSSTPTLAEHWAFAALLLYSGAVLHLLVAPVVQPLCLPWHLAVHGLCLALVMHHDGKLCSSRAFQSEGGRRMMQAVFNSVSWLETVPLLPSHPLPPPWQGQRRQCMAVTAMLQLSVGFLLPTALVVKGESRLFHGYISSHPHPSGNTVGSPCELAYTRLWRKAWESSFAVAPCWATLATSYVQCLATCWLAAMAVAEWWSRTD